MGRWFGKVSGSLALVARRSRWRGLSWGARSGTARGRRTVVAGADDRARRLSRFRYHLGRGRRAREAGRFEQGVDEARRALALSPNDPWALALLGQCLQRQRASDLDGARKELERAWWLEPTNGYFVRLLLGVLDTQGDAAARLDVLTRAWWRGAPVERWLPDGPPVLRTDREAAEAETGRGERLTASSQVGSAAPGAIQGPLLDRQPAGV
jgi:tetratricopeptide (TPR) repeat protein